MRGGRPCGPTSLNIEEGKTISIIGDRASGKIDAYSYRVSDLPTEGDVLGDGQSIVGGPDMRLYAAKGPAAAVAQHPCDNIILGGWRYAVYRAHRRTGLRPCR